jgi:anti-sigma B factor antagonist
VKVDLHADPIRREEIIRRYLQRTLPESAAGEFEDHYLVCDECFEETGATRLLLEALNLPALAASQVGDVAVLRFPVRTQLLRSSLALEALLDAVRIQNESRVLIDLSTVSRIDSAGIGVLMNCYCHVLRNSGTMKLLHPTAPVQDVLKITNLNSVLETFDDEAAAIRSFEP